MRPVVLIPGIGGSILVQKGHETRYLLHKKVPNNRWINVYVATQQGLSRWKKDMHCDLLLDAEGRVSRVVPQVPLVGFDFGGTKGVKDIIPEFLLFPKAYRQWFDDLFHHRYYHGMSEALHRHGYRDHFSLVGAPYDFRFILDPVIRDQYFNALRAAIEGSCRASGEKAVIVTHSLGGVLLKWFFSACVSQEWIDRHVEQWVCVSAPFGGSHNALYAATSGMHYIPSMRSEVQSELQRHLGIIACFPNSLAYHPDEPLIVCKDGAVTVDEYASLAAGGCVPFLLWRDLFQPALEAHIAAPVRVRTHMICANTVNSTQSRGVADAWDAIPSRLEYVSGDGVVPLKSMLAIERVVDRRYLTETIFPNSDHTSLLSDETVIKIVQRYALNRHETI
jgi:hypothetical protein